MLEELNEEARKALESYLPGKAVTDLALNGGLLAETHVAVGDEHEGVFYPKGTIEEGEEKLVSLGTLLFDGDSTNLSERYTVAVTWTYEEGIEAICLFDEEEREMTGLSRKNERKKT